MVKTKYECEVCQRHFNTQEEASEHEKIPITNRDLPKGLVLKNKSNKDIYYIVDKQIRTSKEGHYAVYDEWEVDFYLIKNQSTLGVSIKLDVIMNDHIPFKDISDLLVSDQELEIFKEKIKQAQNNKDYLKRALYLKDINLEELTNKLQ